jgi:hypothetical protein
VFENGVRLPHFAVFPRFVSHFRTLNALFRCSFFKFCPSLTLEEKDEITPRTYHHSHGDKGHTFDYLRQNINKKSVSYSCQKSRSCNCLATMSFKRDKVSGLVDYGQVTHNGRHSRQCVKFHNPSLDPDEYPWEGKVCRWEPWDNDEENADPNITPNVTPFASTFESHQAVNVEEDMKQMVDDMAQADLNIAASHIWDKVSLHFDEKYDRKWTGLNKGPCIDRVRKARKELNHGDAFSHS